jgi:MFS family permease
MASGNPGILQTLRHPNFGIYTAGHAVSHIGTWMQRVAIGWLAWELTQSTAWLGVVAAANLLPAVFVGPFAGAIADRADRLRVVTLTQKLLMVQAVALFALNVSGLISIEALVGLVAFHGVVVGFNLPANKALVPSLVPRDDLPTALAINSIVFNLARFIGPVVAGVFIVSGGLSAAFAANAVSYLAFLAALSRLNIDAAARMPAEVSGATLLGQVGAGYKYVAGHPGIGPLLVMYAALALTVRPVAEMLPAFAAQVFGKGAETLATLTAAMGLGAIVGGVWLARRGHAPGLTRVTLLSVLGLGLATLLFTSSQALWVGLGAMACFGFFAVSASIGTQTLIQLAVAPNMRGRVFGLHGIIYRGGTAVGALAIGAVSEGVGLRGSVAGATVFLALAWVWAWRRRVFIAAALEGGSAD